MTVDGIPRHAITQYSHLDRQYLVHFYRRPDNTENRMQRLEAANKSEWKNKKPEALDISDTTLKSYPPVYTERMPWKYKKLWVRVNSTRSFILASVKKNIIKSEDNVSEPFAMIGSIVKA